MQRISNTDKSQNDSITPEKVLNISMYGSLCASMIIGKLRNRQVAMTWWITANGESLFLVLHCFAGLVQRIFNRDKIQNSTLAPGNVPILTRRPFFHITVCTSYEPLKMIQFVLFYLFHHLSHHYCSEHMSCINHFHFLSCSISVKLSLFFCYLSKHLVFSTVNPQLVFNIHLYHHRSQAHSVSFC